MAARLVIAFIGGAFAAFLAAGVLTSQAIGDADVGPDINLLGAVCLLCPLTGLLAVLVTWRLNRERKT